MDLTDLRKTMRQEFRGYYRPTDEELRHLWGNCVFVFDANVLLNLYRYPKEARDDFLSLLRQIQDRIWLPYQAALEYQTNRLAVIAEQVKRFGEVRKVLTETQKTLQAGLDQLDLVKRHSSINPAGLLSKVSQVFEEFEQELVKHDSNQLKVSDHDLVREEIDKLFESRIGARPADQNALDVIYAEGKSRYGLKRPPGYSDLRDKNEDDIYLVEGLIVKRLYGDLLIWKEMIQKAKTDPKFKYIVFITDDNKEDWWWITESNGKKTIGPRVELVEEMFSEGGVSGFYMYNPQRFLSYAKANLGAAVKEESINQVRDIAQSVERHNREVGEASNFAADAQIAVYHWLRVRYPEGGVIENIVGYPDFVVTIPAMGGTLGFDVKSLRDVRSARIFIEAQTKALYYRKKFKEITTVFVVGSRSRAEHFMETIRRAAYHEPTGVAFVVGFIRVDESGQIIFESV